MSDLGTIGIAIEVRGREALRQIQTDMDSVDRTTKSAARSFEVFERAGLKTAQTFSYMSESAKARLTQETKITQELIKQRSAAEQLAKANAAAYQAKIGSNLGLGGSGTSASASADAYSAEIERLRQKYDKVYVASQLYERSLNELNRAHLLGVTSTQQHEKALEQLNKEYTDFSNASEGARLTNNRFSQHVDEAANGANEFGATVQQVGYQVGDFFVQVQSGTNPMVAFGQQATQLAGLIPGALGAALGIGISLVTALASAYMKANEEAKKADKSLESSKQTLEGLSGSLAKTRLEIEAFKRGLKPDEILEATLAIEALESRRKELLSSNMVESDPWGLSDRLIEMRALKDELEKTLKDLRDAEAEKERLRIGTQRADREPSGTYLEDAAYAERIAEAEAKSAALAREKKDIFHALAGETGSVSQYMDDSYQSGLKLSRLDMGKPITDAALAAEELARNLGISVGLAAEIGKIGTMTPEQSKIYSGVKSGALPDVALKSIGIDQNNFLSDEGFSAPIQWMGLPPNPITSRKTKSGGGSTLGVENKLEEIYKYLEQDKYLIEQEGIAYQQRQDVLEDSLKNKLLTIEEYQQLEKDLRLKHETDVLDIERRTRDTRLSEVGTFFGAMASVAQAGGDKFVKIAKVLGASEAFVNTLVAQSQVLRDPKLGFFGKMAAYAAIGASGLSVVAALKGGGSSVGSVSRGSATVTPSSAAATAAPQTVFIDSIDPESLYSGKSLINLFDAFYNENDKRGKVFVVAR